MVNTVRMLLYIIIIIIIIIIALFRKTGLHSEEEQILNLETIKHYRRQLDPLSERSLPESGGQSPNHLR